MSQAGVADALARSAELREEEEFEKAWRMHGMERSHPGRRKLRDAALERQRHWLLRALIVREAVRAMVLQWRRHLEHWAGVRGDLGLDKLTPWALRRTATPSWWATAMMAVADGRMDARRSLAIQL